MLPRRYHHHGDRVSEVSFRISRQTQDHSLFPAAPSVVSFIAKITRRSRKHARLVLLLYVYHKTGHQMWKCPATRIQRSCETLITSRRALSAPRKRALTSLLAKLRDASRWPSQSFVLGSRQVATCICRDIDLACSRAEFRRRTRSTSYLVGALTSATQQATCIDLVSSIIFDS